MTGRRAHRTRWWGHRLAVASAAVAGVTTVVVLAGIAVSSTPDHTPDPEAEIRAACAATARTLPPPSGLVVPHGHAAPRSPFSRGGMDVPAYPAATAAADRAEREGRTDTANRLRRIAQQPRAVWLTDPRAGSTQTTARVREVVRAAYAQQHVPTVVLYGIPLRDCGQWSAGGAASGAAYQSWVNAVGAGIAAAGSGPGVAVILEPDALSLLDRLPADRRAERIDLLRAAVNRLTGVSGTAVYLDAGHSGWIAPTDMIARLSAAGIAMARGFSLNVSGFGTTQEQLRYGLQLSPSLGWKHFLVDTGRNGRGPTADGQWCNPPGRALGEVPQIGPGLVDAYLWIKPPGESDGACRDGAPPAGVFWPAYADDLARSAGW